MANTDEMIRRLDDLAERARVRDDGIATYFGLLAQAQTAVRDIAGEDSPYWELLHNPLVARPVRVSGGRPILANALSNLRSDVENGYLRRQADLVAAEVFTDFLDMAEQLLEGGYYHAAASLIGAVLEDGLRRMCRAAGLQVETRDGMSLLNNRLAGRGVYAEVARRQVDLWAAIRNNADHGHFDAVSANDVSEMRRGVMTFLAERLP